MWMKIYHMIVRAIRKISAGLHYDISEKQVDNIMQFAKFGLVGAANTMIAYLTYVLVCMSGLNFHIGNIMGFITGTLNSFYWNNKYVFKTVEDEERVWWKALIKTFVSYGLSGLILTEVLLVFWIRAIGASEYIAPILNLFITIPLNFLLNKLWAFRKEK